MKNFRVYGNPPFSVVVVHGGPGAPGEMKPVVEELSKIFGVIEPLQTANSVDGQIEELKKVIERNTIFPVYLIGWSWGAWLSYLLAARYPDSVKKLILVSSGPFETKFAEDIMKTRLERLSEQERKKAEEIMQLLQSKKGNDAVFNEFGDLMNKADSFNPFPHKNDDLKGLLDIKTQSEIYEKVWSETEELRKTGELLNFGEMINCPVIAIHGDYDSHPAEGVKKSLSKVIKNFRFYLLQHCGHHPWFEKEAKNKFYEILNHELRT